MCFKSSVHQYLFAEPANPLRVLSIGHSIDNILEELVEQKRITLDIYKFSKCIFALFMLKKYSHILQKEGYDDIEIEWREQSIAFSTDNIMVTNMMLYLCQNREELHTIQQTNEPPIKSFTAEYCNDNANTKGISFK